MERTKPAAIDGLTRIAIVEDDRRYLTTLVEHVRRYEREHGLRFELSTYTDGAELVENYRPIHDIILLDIEMPGLDGMSAARRVREVDPDVVLVFVTASPQYAVSGYEVAALSYLLKPVRYVALAKELGRSIEQAARRERSYIVVVEAGVRHRIDVADILYVESLKHNIVVHLAGSSIRAVGSLKEMEAELDDRGFFRCNAPFLVNLRHVVAVQQSGCALSDGRKLAVSRPRKKAFLAALSDDVGGVGR